MKLPQPSSLLVIAVLVLGAGVVGWRMFSSASDTTMVDVKVPTLSPAAWRGKAAFDANCARCHGPNGAGSDRGPPLVHDIYNPGHHGDVAFVMAARRGVRSHHWRFGDMPPLPKVSRAEIVAIIRYVRELQEANGIFYRPHRM